VSKSTNTSPDVAGNTVAYKILVENLSGVTANNVVVTDTPQSAAFTSWSAFSIPAGGTVEIDVIMNVAASLAAGVYNNSVSLTTSNTGASISNYNGLSASNTDDDVVIHQLSPLAGSLVINEIMYRATGLGAAGNDEFIELYNAGTTSVHQ